MKKLFVSAIALFAATTLSAQDVTAIYNEAAAAYGAKDYAGAAAQFEQVIDLGLDTADAASLVATAKKSLPLCYYCWEVPPSNRRITKPLCRISRKPPSWPNSTAT